MVLLAVRFRSQKVFESFTIFPLQCDCHEMKDFVLLKRSIVPSTDSVRLYNCNFSSNLCNLEENPCHQIYKAPFEVFLYFQFENTCYSGSGFGEVFFGNPWFCPARVPLCIFTWEVSYSGIVFIFDVVHLFTTNCCSIILKLLVKCFI